MIGLLQRVLSATVEVEGEPYGAIGNGMVVLVAVERGDAEAQADRLLARLLGYRMFADPRGRMNLDLSAVGGGLMLVPQFTLAADTRKGTRPSFSPAAEPEAGERLFDYVVERADERHSPVECGRFGAYMQVALVNDGPVTFWLHVPPDE